MARATADEAPGTVSAARTVGPRPTRTRAEYTASRPVPRDGTALGQVAPYHVPTTMSPVRSFHAQRPNPGSPARLGRLLTPHGAIETPAFLVLGTQGAAASLLPPEVAALGGQAILASTYHLSLRPGANLIADAGGLHPFMGWSGPLVADSGGYPIGSRAFGPRAERAARGRQVGTFAEREAGARRRPNATASAQALPPRIDDDGFTYRSHVDGSTHRLTPESSILVQEQLGADIMTALDEPTAPDHDEARTARAAARTHRWAERALAARRGGAALFAAVAGGAVARLCRTSARVLGDLPFDGYLVGGTAAWSAGARSRVLASTVPLLPEDRPRRFAGVGGPAELFRGVEAGVDLFDSALPFWLAGRGVLMTADGPLAIARAAYREDDGPPDPTCTCPTCATFSRAYLRHLFVAEELLAATLAATHNLAFVLGLLARIRAALGGGSLAVLKAEVLGRYGALRPR